MIEVSKISYFSPNHLITPFTGKSYDESIQSAETWALENVGKVKLVSFYKQLCMGRSILVSYEEIHENGN